ncbi:MAG: ScbR family autoregulator-binding transcription factor [Microterricola sp.]
MAQQDRAIQTRERIVTGAATAFYRVGYADASIATIAETAGVTKGALYFHFNSKEEIARAVIDEQHRRVTVSAAEIFEATATVSPAETMMLMCADLAGWLVNDVVVRAGIRLTTGGAIFDPPTRAPYDDWLATFEDLVGRAVGAGEFRQSTDPARLAHFIIPSFTGVQLLSDVLTNMDDLKMRVGELWDVLLAAFAEPARLDELLALRLRIFGPSS